MKRSKLAIGLVDFVCNVLGCKLELLEFIVPNLEATSLLAKYHSKSELVVEIRKHAAATRMAVFENAVRRFENSRTFLCRESNDWLGHPC